MIKLWSDERITKEISIENLKINTTTASFSDIIKQYITTGEKYDILMLPYFPTYIEIITKIREKGFLGVIIIVVSKNEAIFQPESAIENQIFAINTQKLGKSETISILNFLIKNEMEKLEFYKKNSVNEKEDIEKIYKTNTKNTKKLDNLDIFDKKNIPNADKIITILKENEQQLLMTLDPNSLENTKTKMKLSGQIIDNTQHGFITIGNIDPKLNLKKMIKQNDNISISFNLGEIFLSLNATVIEVGNLTKRGKTDCPETVINIGAGRIPCSRMISRIAVTMYASLSLSLLVSAPMRLIP